MAPGTSGTLGLLALSNPFDLPGPDFLLFFLVLAAAALFLLWLYRRSMETSREAPGPLRDPLAVAYLRRGPAAVLRVVIFGLVNRKVLRMAGVDLVAGEMPPATRLTPLEEALVKRFSSPRRASFLMSDRNLLGLADVHVRPGLEAAGLLPMAEQRKARWTAAVVALAVVEGTAVAKIVVALERGRTNIGFLILLALGFLGVVIGHAKRRATAQGRRALKDLAGLVRQQRPVPMRAGAADADPALMLQAALAGVMGATFLPRKAKASGNGCGSVFGGCGGGGCGGSSCGGGGCGGGGCGGCGGGS